MSEIKGLSHAKTDHARARAWIRLAINEQSLGLHPEPPVHLLFIVRYISNMH